MPAKICWHLPHCCTHKPSSPMQWLTAGAHQCYWLQLPHWLKSLPGCGFHWTLPHCQLCMRHRLVNYVNQSQPPCAICRSQAINLYYSCILRINNIYFDPALKYAIKIQQQLLVRKGLISKSYWPEVSLRAKNLYLKFGMHTIDNAPCYAKTEPYKTPSRHHAII